MGADRAGRGPHPRRGGASTSPAFANSLSLFANVGSMQFTQRQWSSSRMARAFMAALALGLLLGFAGPFGSYPAYSTATRYAFWLAMTMVGAAAALAAEALLSRAKLRAGAVRLGALALISAVPMTFVVAWTLSLLQPGRAFTLQQMPLLFACVAVVQLLVVLATTFARPAAEEFAGTAPEEGPAAFPPALLGRLPPEIGSEILSIETEDHYLRVHTARGNTLILMRMADAVALLDSSLGAQVHRRWWVAEAAVVRSRADGQRLLLELIDGRVVPVGRTFAAAARARFAPASRRGAPVSTLP